MVVGWHVSSRAIRTGLVRTGTEVVNWDAFRLMRCCRCVVRNNRITNIKLRSYGNSFYILNFTVYLFLIWWVVNKYLVATMAAASLEYWIFFFVLILLAVSSVGYWMAHYFWDSGYWGMFFKMWGCLF